MTDGMTSYQIIVLGLSIGLPLTGGVVGVLKWSISRNIREMDDKVTAQGATLNALAAKFDTLYQRQEDLRAGAMPREDCLTCRRECQSRMLEVQRTTQEWMRRQEDKMDRIIMMLAHKQALLKAQGEG